MNEKYIFLVVFIIVGYVSYSFSAKASEKISDINHKKIPLYNPFWFLYPHLFEKSDKKFFYTGAIVQLIFLSLFAWGFPKYILQWW